MTYHRDTETQSESGEPRNEISQRVIGAAIEVHRHLGPGLLESIYEECLAMEFELRGIEFRRQAEVLSHYKGKRLTSPFKVDFRVEETLLIELKAVESLHEVHTAQLLTYLRLTNFSTGLLINFNVPVLWKGVRRIVNGR